MRSRSLIGLFMAMALPGLAILPAVNLWQGTATIGSAGVTGNLFSLDLLRPMAAGAAYVAGISLNPGNVIMGHDGWLYLGDKHDQSVSRRRLPLPKQQADKARASLDRYLTGWSQWATEHDAKFVMVAFPDKESLYPEHVPAWSQGSGLITQVWLNLPHRLGIGSALQPLREAKSKSDAPLYYATDSHWNALGAWTGYAVTMDAVGQTMPLPRLGDDDVKFGEPVSSRGDLADLAYLPARVEDARYPVEFVRPVDVRVTEYETGAPLSTNGNPAISSLRVPTLVESPGALNHIKVLWLRDSFGNALSPYISATFSEVLHAHHSRVTAAELRDLIEHFKPDLVLITTVERFLLGSSFTQTPE